MQTSFIVNPKIATEFNIVEAAKQIPLLQKNITEYIDRYVSSGNAGAVATGSDLHWPRVYMSRFFSGKKVRLYYCDINNPAATKNIVLEADNLYGEFTPVQYDGADYHPLGSATEDWEDETYGEDNPRLIVTKYRQSQDGLFKYWYTYKKLDGFFSSAFVGSTSDLSFTGTKTPCVFNGYTGYQDLYIADVMFDTENKRYVALVAANESGVPVYGTIFTSTDGVNWNFVSRISPIEYDTNFTNGGELFSATSITKIGNIWLATGPVMDMMATGVTTKSSSYALSVDLVNWYTFPKYTFPMNASGGPLKYDKVFATAEAWHSIWTNGSKIFIASMPHVGNHPVRIKQIGAVGTSGVTMPSLMTFPKNSATVTVKVSNSSASAVKLNLHFVPALREVAYSNTLANGYSGGTAAIEVAANSTNVVKAVFVDDVPHVAGLVLSASADASLTISVLEIDKE